MLSGLAIAAMLIVLAMITAPMLVDPRFEVNNRAAVAVTVDALWRDRQRRLPPLPPGASHRFRIDDEAAIRFRVTYPDGRSIVSEERYFTGGSELFAVIGDGGVEVRYAFETD